MTTPAALSGQIESAWTALTESPRLIRFYLTDDGRLQYGQGGGWEVGWYSSAVTLADFRDDCFHVFESLRRASNGR